VWHLPLGAQLVELAECNEAFAAEYGFVDLLFDVEGSFE
jgi:hypothetical protein